MSAKDVIALYGFSTRRERMIFEKLHDHFPESAPKLAVTILSGGSVEELVGAIKRSDPPASHCHFRESDKKTAERIILELKGQIPGFH